MRVLACIASQRKNGNTARAVKMLRAALQAQCGRQGIPLEFETAFLGDLRIQSCRGCRRCFDRGEQHCPLQDDLLAFRDRMLAADALVLASPVYVNDVSGTMKTLIDRLAFACHRPAFYALPACFLATTGSSPARHTLRTLQAAWLSMGGPAVAALGLKTGALSSTEEIGRRHGRAIAALALRLMRHLREKRTERPSFVSLMMFRIQQWSWRRLRGQSGKDSVDSRYWQERGWFQQACTFYLPHRAPRLRVIAARAVGTLLARIFAA